MAQDYNIIVSVENNINIGGATPVVGGKKKKSVAKGFEDIGLKKQLNEVRATVAYTIISNSASKISSSVGALSGNQQLQTDINIAKRFGGHALMTVLNPAVGISSLGLDVAGSIFEYGIKKRNMKLEAEALQYISGNTANSGMRYRGGKL